MLASQNTALWFNIWRQVQDDNYELVFSYQFTPSADQVNTRAVVSQ